MKEVESAIDAINTRDARVNASCGLHITLTFNGDTAALARLISLVGNHERAIFASTGSRRREHAVYTKKIKQYGDKDTAKSRCESGWYKGDLRKKTFGEITNGDQTPDWKTIKTKPLDLARKYDCVA